MNESELVENFVAQARSLGAAISEASTPAWLSELEERLPFPLPRLYRLLLAKYEFEPFEIHGIELFGNVGEPSEHDNIASRLFADKAFVEVLLPARLLYFARPSTGTYDPVCLELSPKAAGGQVVLLDHEQILCRSRIVVSKVLFPSLRAMFLAPAA